MRYLNSKVELKEEQVDELLDPQPYVPRFTREDRDKFLEDYHRQQRIDRIAYWLWRCLIAAVVLVVGIAVVEVLNRI